MNHDQYEVETVQPEHDHLLHPEPFLAARVREGHNLSLAELRATYPDAPRIVFHLMAGTFVVYTVLTDDHKADRFVSGRFVHEILARLPRQKKEPKVAKGACGYIQPPGWRCTRGTGHDGPCALVSDEIDVPMPDGSPFTETTTFVPPQETPMEDTLMPPRENEPGPAPAAPAAPVTRTRAPKTIEIGTPMVAGFSIRIDLEDLFPYLKLPEGVDRKALTLEKLKSLTVARDVGGPESSEIDIEDPTAVTLHFGY